MRLNFLIGLLHDGTAKILNPDSFGDPSKLRQMLHTFKTSGAPAGVSKVLHYVDPYDVPRVIASEPAKPAKTGK